mmetsp:Transcript_39948/g.66000  ORF Transcript_39948/g.66000 Transcript_39948/m.66000 type:complete len:325 (-) Transcript_39948:264-1238(-)
MSLMALLLAVMVVDLVRCGSVPAAAEECANDDHTDLLQTKANVESHQKLATNTTAERVECCALDVSVGIFDGTQNEFTTSTFPVGEAELQQREFTIVQKYESTSAHGDEDRAWLLQKHGACFLVFMGSNHNEDFLNEINFAPIDKWGIQGAHAGVVAELELFVNKFDFNQMKSVCTGPLIVTGYALGGGLAQLFSLALNNEAFPLAVGLKVDFLYTFGAMAVIADAAANGNKKSSDGCFAGTQYWYAEKDGTDYVVDVVAMPFIGGQVCHVPSKSTKVLVFSNKATEIFPCGTPLPQSKSLYLKYGLDQWVPLTMGYHAYLGCP